MPTPDQPMVIPADVADNFTDHFDDDLAHDLATLLTCSEVEALADLLTAMERSGLAEVWIDAHADGDDAGDLHHRPTT
ncbi:hypothetical protein [Sphaerisporangium sp. NPDC051011]|uniref:hypothetical protein n=1 Tax=Sphaerisporangium sp. NPDC051011 TaxID=3155792 RepID=UPI0033C30CA4